MIRQGSFCGQKMTQTVKKRLKNFNLVRIDDIIFKKTGQVASDMRIVIIDDCVEDIEQSKRIICMAFSIAGLGANSITCYTDSTRFIEEFTENAYDIIFMDIIMDTMDGIAAATKVRAVDKYVKLVFSTSSNDFASQSYEVGADYYLKKPYDIDQTVKMLQRLRIPAFDEGRYIVLPEGDKVILRSILYTIYFNHVIEIHLTNGNSIRTRLRQIDLERLIMLQPYFVKCSKGSIVNMYEVDCIKENEVVLSDGTAVQVSRRKLKDMEKLYADFMFDKMRRELLQ